MTTNYEDLGRLVAWARIVEQSAYLMARSLGVLDPEHLAISDALKQARSQATIGLPPWSRNVTPEAIFEWIDDARHLMEYRNERVHWEHLVRFTDEGWKPLRISPRSSREAEPEEDEILGWIEKADDLIKRAIEIQMGITFEIRDHVSMMHPDLARDPQQGPNIYAYEVGWPARPTPEEVEAWWVALTQNAPSEWWSWPRTRHSKQKSRRPRGSSTDA